MESQENNSFSTDNFALSAYLLSEGCHLLYVEKTNPKRVQFVFEESDLRKSLTEKFLSHQAQIEPHRYFSAQKDLKQIIYQNR